MYGSSTVGAQRLPKNCESHIDASHSWRPLVKGVRLVRYEVNAVMDVGLEARALGQGVWEMRWLEVWWQEFPRPPM